MTIPQRVLLLVAENRATTPDQIRPGMTFHELGIDGDDAVELIEAVCELFSIDPKEIDLGRYTIGPEGWGFGLNSPPNKFISLKDCPPDPVELRVEDLIRSAETGRWFDPASPNQ